MSDSRGGPSFPKHGGNSDSLDVVTLHIDGPTDLPLGPAHPAVKKANEAERAKIQRWKEQQGETPPQDSRG
jgi:hypothetical protein